MSTSTTVEYDSSTSRLTIPSEFRALVRYRDLLWLLVLKTIKTRYKRSVLGVAWTLLNPLVNMVVMSVAFSAFFRGAISRYPVYLLVGLTAWSFFSQNTAYAMGQLVWGSTLLKRVYIPPTIFAVACVGNGLVNLAFALVPLLAIMIVLGHPLHATWWFLPVAVLILSLFSLGVALFMSTFAVLFVDVVDMYQLFLQAWFFLTPIIYPKEMLGKEYPWLIEINPMFHMVELMRLPLYDGVLPSLRTLLISCAWAAAALGIGAWTFTRKADEFAYRI
jgi:homopolymeric O-antigen transport system permease protein